MLKIEYFLLLLFLANKIYSNESILSIYLIDNIKYAKFITPITDDENNLYILSGNYSDKNIEENDTIFNRAMLKFNSNGQLIGNYCFISDYIFNYPEIVYFKKNNGNYLLLYTSSSLELFNIETNKIIKETNNTLDSYEYKSSLKKIDNNNYFYVYINWDNIFLINHILFKNEEESYLIESHEIDNILVNKGIISCDVTHGNDLFILCMYLNKNDDLEISSFSSDFAFIKKQTLENMITPTHDYFFKIIYFKNNNKFIIMYSFEDFSRLRYIKYINNRLVNQLGLILDDENDYLDIAETQLSPLYDHNDIISINSSKVLKISTNLDDIIISIYDIYDSDSALSIKTYKFKNINNYKSFINPRLSIFNNIIVVCLSTLYLTEQRIGYFFISYPKPSNLEITSNNNIEIKNLISIENNLFNYISKIKIIDIPSEFVFYNSNDKPIEIGDILFFNDSLVFKQYKINSTSYLKYEVISLEDYDNDSPDYEIIYPSNSEKNVEKANILINGGNGILTISISDCDNDFLPLENENMCSYISNIPEGFYLDDNQDKFVRCYNNCKSCFGPYLNNSYMNCRECQEGYTKTEDTYSCYNSLPLYYYLDKNIFRRCSQNCTKCFNYTENSCLDCISGFTYYLSSNSCIDNNDIVEEKMSHNESRFRWIFIFIFVIAIIIGAIIVFRPLENVELEVSRYTFQGTMNEEKDKRKRRKTKEEKDINRALESIKTLQEMPFIDSS